jgi:2-methylcitrate dehydratase PrpD
MDYTAQLADFVATSSFEQLPDDVVLAAKIAILDGIANLVAGCAQPIAAVVRPYVNGKAGVEESSVVGQRQKLPASSAAWLNGVFMHCLDYEVQGYPSSHGTSSILPAALAVGERRGASGSDLLLSYVIGWDVQQRIRTAGEHGDMRGFHPPGVVGPMGAAAAAARVLGLDPKRTATAFGLAASRASGLFANNGTMTKATHPGNAARTGVESAELAAAGLTANLNILEDPRGFVSAIFGGVFDWPTLVEGLGTRYHLVDPGYTIKPYPAEIYMQWPIDAARTLRARGKINFRDIAAVVVEPPAFRKDLSRPSPESGLDGKFSYEYCVAVALTQEAVTIGSFSDDVRFSADIVDMLPKITLKRNPDISSDKRKTWTRITVTLADGQELVERCDKFIGNVERPMTRDAHLAKVVDCLSVGGCSPQQAAEIVACVDELENLSRIDELARLLTI